ncbi:MAG: hypothetical protein H7251_09220 [Acetobacteraceae bacterium]|nr:hypothetical protein [Acetobacteraceae bacterium]
MADEIAPLDPTTPKAPSRHLVERMAQRLRGIGGLSAPKIAQPNEVQASADQSIADAEAEIEPPANPDAGPQGATEDDISFADTPIVNAPIRPNVEAMLARVVADAPPGLARAAAELARNGAQPGTNLRAAGETSVPNFIDHAMLEKAGMVVGRKLRTRISEEFRITVGAILRSLKGSYTPGRGAGNLLMVTSSRPGEGKSFTSLNLAGSIAQHTQREVLLVDVDAKQHSLTDLIGVGDLPGLIDLAANASLRVEDTIVRTAISNLSFLPVGVRREDGGDLAADSVPRPVTSLIERLGRRFPNHLIILDAPPCLSTSDPSTLGPHVGQVVMVVEAERTQRAEVMASLDLLKACPQIILLLNKIKVTTSYTFGAYHYGAYNYSGTYP